MEKVTMTGNENIHMKAMEERLVKMENKLEKLDRNVTTISEALLSNEYNPNGGMVHVLKDHEERIEKIEDANVLSHEARIKMLEDNSIMHKSYGNILKFIAGVITTGVLTYLLSVIFKQP
jgi:hypothetical protein